MCLTYDKLTLHKIIYSPLSDTYDFNDYLDILKFDLFLRNNYIINLICPFNTLSIALLFKNVIYLFPIILNI